MLLTSLGQDSAVVATRVGTAPDSSPVAYSKQIRDPSVYDESMIDNEITQIPTSPAQILLENAIQAVDG